MATTYFADNYNVPMPNHPGVGVSLKRSFLFTFAVAFVINDIVKLCRIPGGGTPIVITDFYIDVPDLDTDVSPAIALSVGITATPGAFVAIQTAVGQSAGKLSMDGDGVAAYLPKQFSTNDDFLLKITTGPATGATSGSIRGWLEYHHVGAASPV